MKTLKTFKLFWLYMVIIMIITFKSYADYHMGGELTWANVGKDSFLVTLILYTDCNSYSPSSPSIAVKCASTGTTVTTINISVPTPVDITPVCYNSCTRCQSSSCTFPYGIYKYVFTKLVIFNTSSCCDFILQYNYCCRTATLTTGGAGSTFYIYGRLNRCYADLHSSPVFQTHPYSILCVGQDALLDFGAYDDDKDSNGHLIDSITYELVRPMTGQSNYITYTGSYSYDKPLFFWGFPNANLPSPRGFFLNPANGKLSFRPMKVEQGLVAVKACEWRKINNQMIKIGEIIREVQVIVMSCPNNSPPIVYGPFYKEVCAGDTVSFTITSYDADSKDTITLSWQSYLQGATWSVNNGQVKHPTLNMSWLTSVKNISYTPYIFFVTATDNACPKPNIYYASYQILVKPGPKSVTFKDSVINCNIHKFSIVNPPKSPALEYNWTFGQSNPVKLSGNPVTFYSPGPGVYHYELNVSTSGCETAYYTDSFIQGNSLYIKPFNDFIVCEKDSVLLDPQIQYNQGNVNYVWSTGENSSKIIIKPSGDTIISVVVSDDAKCMATDTLKITVNPLTNIILDKYHLICGNIPAELKPQFSGGTYTPSEIYFYNAANQLLAKGKSSISLTDSGIYRCQVVNNYGCTTSILTHVYQRPAVIASAQDKNVCPGETAYFTAQSTGSQTQAVNYYWYDIANDQLLSTQQLLSFAAEKDKTFRLVVKESFLDKYCADSSLVKLNIKPIAVRLNFPDTICKYDSLIDIRLFIDTLKGDITSNHYYIENHRYYHPSLIKFSVDSILFTLTDYQSGCVFNKTVGVILFPLPEVNAYNKFNQYEFCSKYGKIPVYGTPSGGKYGGKWYGPVKDGYFDANCPEGTYTLIYEYRDNYGCMNRDTMVMKVAQPGITIDKTDTSICNGENFEAKAYPSGTNKIKWIIPLSSDGYLLLSQYNAVNQYIPGVKDKENHGFWLKVKTNDIVCSIIYDSVYVYIGAVPHASFTSNVSLGTQPLEVNFTDKSTIDYDNISNYLWDFGDGSTSTIRHPVHTYQDTGYYDVSLKVTSNYGCQDSVTRKKMIYVNPVSLPENAISQLKVYPNPAHEKIIIESDDQNLKTVVLTNILGIKIREFRFHHAQSFLLERNKLPAGVYLLKITDNNGNLSVFTVIFQ